MLVRSRLAVLAILVTFGVPAVLAHADDEPAEPGPVPEIQLCRLLRRHEVIRGEAVEEYISLLTSGDVAGWNKKRRATDHKLLDLAGKTWDTRGRADLPLALEGLDLRGIDLQNVVFMPGSSFQCCALSEASFRGACLEGVTFSSVVPFEARSVADVRSSSLAGADLRDVVWTWDTALERTARRVYGDLIPGETAEDKQARKDRRRADLDRRVAGLEGDPSSVFSFVDLAGVKTDESSPLLATEGSEAVPYARTLARLVHAATTGTLAEAVETFTNRHRHLVADRPNPLEHEPALAAAIAAVDSDLAGIATWRAVSVVNASADAVVFVGGRHTLLVVDEEHSVGGSRLLVSACPIVAWRRGTLPTTVCSRPVVLKDQSVVNGVVVGQPIFALADGLRADPRRGGAESGTFASPIVAGVEGVENLTPDEADRRFLAQASIRDFALSVGAGEGDLASVGQEDGVSPETALPATIRRAIKRAVGKEAFADMECYTLSEQRSFQNAGGVPNVLCTNPHAILVVDRAPKGSIYSKGPIVILDGEQATFRRCASKSWIAVRGIVPQGHVVLAAGERVDVPASEDLKKDE